MRCCRPIGRFAGSIDRLRCIAAGGHAGEEAFGLHLEESVPPGFWSVSQRV